MITLQEVGFLLHDKLKCPPWDEFGEKKIAHFDQPFKCP